MSRTVGAEARLPSQSLYRVAPGGERVAWIAGSALHVRDAAGHERSLGTRVHLFRFSPDGAQLAFVDGRDVVLADLAGEARRSLGQVAGQAAAMEWIRGGPVVLARSGEGPRRLTWFPVAGAARVLAQRPEHVELLAGSPTSSRVALFTFRGAFLVDAASDAPARPLLPPAELERFRLDQVITAELAPDGNELTWSDEAGMHSVDLASGQVTRVNRLNARSLWYGPDGALAYTSLENAFVRHGQEVARLDERGRYGLVMLRYRRDAPGLVAVRDHDVIAWDPASGKRERLARVDGDLLDADVFRGGLLTLIARPDPTDPPRHR